MRSEPTGGARELQRPRSFARRQAGVISAGQAAALGVSLDGIRRQLRAGRLIRLHEGVYLTGNMRPGVAAVRWAALLASGDGAVLSHATAADIYGFTRRASMLVHVSIPASRVEVAASGVRVHRSRLLPAKATLHEGWPITTAEDTVLDLVSEMRSPHDVVALLTDACRNKAVTAEQILKAVGRRKRQRHRQLVKDVVADVIGGVEACSSTSTSSGWNVRTVCPADVVRSRCTPGACRSARTSSTTSTRLLLSSTDDWGTRARGSTATADATTPGRAKARPRCATDTPTSRSRARQPWRWRRCCGAGVGRVNLHAAGVGRGRSVSGRPAWP